jgi:glutathione-regulated potassium-efflux system ancillary protein KefG
MPHRILVLFAHPAVATSRVQVTLAQAARETPGVTLHDLYDAYPEYDIDVPAEQERLLAHDVVLFQFPFYWYSVPPLIKQWFDLVLEHGWAYGSRGDRLAGKWGGVAMSAGGRAAAYTADGYNRRTFGEFLAPVEQTVRLCKMRWLPPFVVAGTHAITAEAAAAEAATYRRWLDALRDGRVDPVRVEGMRDAVAVLDHALTPAAS